MSTGLMAAIKLGRVRPELNGLNPTDKRAVKKAIIATHRVVYKSVSCTAPDYSFASHHQHGRVTILFEAWWDILVIHAFYLDIPPLLQFEGAFVKTGVGNPIFVPERNYGSSASLLCPLVTGTRNIVADITAITPFVEKLPREERARVHHAIRTVCKRTFERMIDMAPGFRFQCCEQQGPYTIAFEAMADIFVVLAIHRDVLPRAPLSQGCAIRE
jgi:hypothetical protein